MLRNLHASIEQLKEERLKHERKETDLLKMIESVKKFIQDNNL